MRVFTKIAYIALALVISLSGITLLETNVAYATESESGGDSDSGDGGGEREEKARKKGDNDLNRTVGAELSDIKGQLALLARKARETAVSADNFARLGGKFDNSDKAVMRSTIISLDKKRQLVLDLLNEMVFWQKVADVPHRQIVASIRQAKLTIDQINGAQADIRSILN